MWGPAFNSGPHIWYNAPDSTQEARRSWEGRETMNMRLSLYNFVMVGLLAVVFILGAKMALTKWNVPGLSPTIQAV